MMTWVEVIAVALAAAHRLISFYHDVRKRGAPIRQVQQERLGGTGNCLYESVNGQRAQKRAGEA
jgi:hypothetical protein